VTVSRKPDYVHSQFHWTLH